MAFVLLRVADRLSRISEGGVVFSATSPADASHPTPPLRPISNTFQELIHVNPPKLEDFSSSEESGSDDDDARPLTRDELKGRTLNKIQRKHAREGGGRGKGRGGRAK